LFDLKLTLLPHTYFFTMISNSLLGITSISQWALFLGIAIILFGWIEKKEKFILAGQVVFLLLGFFAFYILITDQISIPQTNGNNIPKELKVLAFLKGVVVLAVFSLVSLVQKLFKLRYQKAGLYVLLIFALLLFFMIFNAQQMVN